MPEEEKEEVKQAAINFTSILAGLFGDSLDRKTLWERIGNGIVVCCSKCGGDWEAFVNQMLQYIKADGMRVASSKSFADIIETLAEKPKAWREAWLRVLETKHFLIIVKARALWNATKDAKAKDREELAKERQELETFVDDIPGEVK
jgi:multimeric flavodoxin WrbA